MKIKEEKIQSQASRKARKEASESVDQLND